MLGRGRRRLLPGSTRTIAVPWEHSMAAHADIEVLTFKEGLLSRVGHDLKLRIVVTKLQVDEQAPSVRARMDAAALRVVCAMSGGRELPGELSDKDVRSIEQALREQVLRTERYPDIRFESTRITPNEVVGLLTLHGVAREVCLQWREEAGARVAQVRLDLREWGIQPFHAMLGALRLKPEVQVRVRLTA
jgi:hypothetical protein